MCSFGAQGMERSYQTFWTCPADCSIVEKAEEVDQGDEQRKPSVYCLSVTPSLDRKE
jgi:hypothetical protein